MATDLPMPFTAALAAVVYPKAPDGDKNRESLNLFCARQLVLRFQGIKFLWDLMPVTPRKKL